MAATLLAQEVLPQPPLPLTIATIPVLIAPPSHHRGWRTLVAIYTKCARAPPAHSPAAWARPEKGARIGRDS